MAGKDARGKHREEMNQDSEDIILTTLSSTAIKIQSSTCSSKSLRLSPNDWIIASINSICCIYFYDIKQWAAHGKKTNEEFINVKRLMSSLTKLLEYYPLLAGVFKLHDTDKKISIEQDDDRGGILFVSTSVNIPLSHLPLSVDAYTSTMALPESLQLTNKTDSHAIFHVRHTRFTCGSVALGIHLNHGAGDAHSYFQVVKDWALIYKNFEYQPVVCHQRSLLEPTLADIEERKHSWPDFDQQKTLFVKEETSSPPGPTVQSITKVFRFSADELDRMKSDAIAHVSSDVEYVSTFDVLTAHLYRHVALARRSSLLPITKLYISTNIRSRLKQPPIPWTYFGNAIMLSYLEMDTTQLVDSNHLGPLASQVHQAIVANTSDEIQTTLAWIICQPDKSKITPTFNLDQSDFGISAWNKMGMYSDSDFESGVYPCRITLPYGTAFNGAAILFSTEKNDASIDVILGLTIDEMERLENNSEFRKFR